MFSLEHIDPRNSKHVCGLCNEFNEVLADASYNFRKSNRFVPYRICEHPAPVMFGDVGEFLINGEWVVCEFGGEIWWNETNRIGCGSTDGNDWERGELHRDMMRKVQATYFNDPRCVAGRLKGAQAPASEKQKEAARQTGLRNVESGHLAAIRTPEICSKGGKAAAKALHSQLWRCLVTGKTTRNAGALTHYQRARNIDTSLRERLE